MVPVLLTFSEIEIEKGINKDVFTLLQKSNFHNDTFCRIQRENLNESLRN